jgi:D-glycero-D-manno-heptose 1,7-bisphosphate phosphatase
VTAGPAVFLDRDGVINDLWYDEDHGRLDSPRSRAQFRFATGTLDGLRLLHDAGWPVVVVSNQPGVAKGTLRQDALDDITAAMLERLSAAGTQPVGVYYCTHHPDGRTPALAVVCRCRKPGPGLLLRAAEDLGIDLARSWMVGDGDNDMLAGRRAGCRCVWVGRWKCEHCQAFAAAGLSPPLHASDLLDAARLIIAEGKTDAAVP